MSANWFPCRPWQVLFKLYSDQCNALYCIVQTAESSLLQTVLPVIYIYHVNEWVTVSRSAEQCFTASKLKITSCDKYLLLQVILRNLQPRDTGPRDLSDRGRGLSTDIVEKVIIGINCLLWIMMSPARETKLLFNIIENWFKTQINDFDLLISNSIKTSLK